MSASGTCLIFRSSNAELLQARRHGVPVSIQESIEPVKLPVKTFHQVPGLASPSQVVVFPGEHHNFGGNTEMPERAEPLLTLLDWDSEIVIRVQY